MDAPPSLLSRLRGQIPEILRSERLVLVLAGLYFLALVPFVPQMATARNATEILANAAPLLVVALGQTLVLITGGIDLSVVSVISLASVIGAKVMSEQEGLLASSPLAVPVAVVAMVLVGVGIGIVNGLSIARLGMPPFMVTLCTMIFFQGLAEWLTEARSIGELPETFVVLGSGKIGPLPGSALIAVALALGAGFLLERTTAGRWFRAIGHAPRVARAAGLPTARALVLTYALSGAFAGLASILYTARLETGSPVLGERLLLDIIGAVVLGGTSLYGGRGRISWTVSGVLFMTILGNSLVMLGLSHFRVMILKGSVILVAATLDAWRTRLRGD